MLISGSSEKSRRVRNKFFHYLHIIPSSKSKFIKFGKYFNSMYFFNWWEKEWLVSSPSKHHMKRNSQFCRKLQWISSFLITKPARYQLYFEMASWNHGTKTWHHKQLFINYLQQKSGSKNVIAGDFSSVSAYTHTWFD